jgi:hypothetical protein
VGRLASTPLRSAHAERAPAAHHGPRSKAEWGSKDDLPHTEMHAFGQERLIKARQPVTFDRPRHPTERSVIRLPSAKFMAKK